MALADLVDELQKEADEGAEDEGPSEEEIKEAYAAGQVAGMSYVNTLEKLAQEAAKEEMGDEYDEYEGQDSATSEDSAESTVDKLKKKINEDQSAEKNVNNDAGAGSAENNEDTSQNPPNQPDTNKEESLSKSAAQQILGELVDALE